tara:strand:- start:516 stop:983 length:468 start_codon:yes stop_codon:yes gene_type:complete
MRCAIQYREGVQFHLIAQILKRMKLTKPNTKKELSLKQLAMVESMEKNLGIVTTSCRQVGIARVTHYEWLKTNKEYRKEIKDIENVALDFAESNLHKQIAKGNPLSTMFYLKCKGKKRGFIEQNIVELKGNMKFKADFGTSNTIHTTSEAEGDTQ